MNIRPTEYGRRGIAGLGVPQANPTAEQEAFALRQPGLSIVTTRLVSFAADLEQRLMDYIAKTAEYTRAFDDLELDVFGIACTGSSYLLGADAEDRLTQDLSRELGYPVITAAAAVRDALVRLNAKRIAIVSPYPDWLADSAVKYWTDQAFEIVDIRAVSVAKGNIHAIYALTSADALREAQQLDLTNVDAVLFTGTGMPTLGAINPLHEETGIPVLASNLCLMSAISRSLELTDDALLPVPEAQVLTEL